MKHIYRMQGPRPHALACAKIQGLPHPAQMPGAAYLVGSGATLNPCTQTL